MIISGFDCINFKHIAGHLNVAADVLSRDPDDYQTSKDEIFVGLLLAQAPRPDLIEDFKNLSEIQKLDDKIGEIFNSIEQKTANDKEKKNIMHSQKFVHENNKKRQENCHQ